MSTNYSVRSPHEAAITPADIDNRLTRLVARLGPMPASLRPCLLSKLLGWTVPFIGTAGIRFEELVPGASA